MKPENAPPPMPARKARIISSQYGAVGDWTRTPQPRVEASSSSDVSVTILRVPRIGGSVIHTSRNRPAERPGMAAIQYSWESLKV